MKQVLQSLRDGATELIDVPRPQVRPGHLLVATRRSLISAGTERMLLEFGRAGWLQKARQQPDKVRAALDKIRTDGLLPTLEAVRSRLDEPVPMGYCSVGTVLEAGRGVTGFAAGDRVASNGPHAELVCVPQNLCARVPDGVDDDTAAFTVLSAVALQGLRLAEPTLGETFAVIGLGLVGLLTVQLLRAQGCRVIGLDVNPQRLRLAASFGADVVDIRRAGGVSPLIPRVATQEESGGLRPPLACADPIEAAMALTRGRGVDGVLIAASTPSSDPVRQAAQMCRKRGRIVLVGVSGLELSRADFYEKELTFQVSCSYGPGRYDAEYEQHGRDYPLPFVRWTAQRNFEAVLDLMSAGRVSVERLVTHRFPLERVVEAYGVIGGGEPSLGVLLEYGGGVSGRNFEERVCTSNDAGERGSAVGALQPPLPPLRKGGRVEAKAAPSHGGCSALIAATTSSQNTPRRPHLWFSRRRRTQHAPGPTVAFIGAGNFARRVLMPAFRDAGAALEAVASEGGLSAAQAARRFGFRAATTDLDRVLESPDIAAVVIATRHDRHADLAVQALQAGKHVFVEKPLALCEADVERVIAAYEAGSRHDGRPQLMVGFNRRFAPHVRRMRQLLGGVPGPKAFVATINAGAVLRGHWTQDAEVGGGRIVGEACHFIDLLRHLSDAPIVDWQAAGVGTGTGPADTATITLQFAGGSTGTIHYFANGHRGFPKERIEAFAGGRVLQLDNFRVLRGWGVPGFRNMRLWRQDRGHRAEVRTFLDAIRTSGPPPIAFDELIETARVSLAVAAQLDGSTQRTPAEEAAAAMPPPHFPVVKDGQPCRAS